MQNLQITNDVLESDGGVFAGGIGVGQPYYDSHNTNVRIAYNRVLGNGGLTRAGGIGIFRGSNNYEIANSVLCSNFGVEYGARHLPLGPEPRRVDPRQPDLLQRRGRLGRRHRDLATRCRAPPTVARRRLRQRSTSTGT